MGNAVKGGSLSGLGRRESSFADVTVLAEYRLSSFFLSSSIFTSDLISGGGGTLFTLEGVGEGLGALIGFALGI